MKYSEEDSPRVLSDDEIELYLNGDRREVDRLILISLNRLASSLIPHMESEREFMAKLKQLGGMDAIISRAAYVDSLILRNTAKSAMMAKVLQSTIIWAFIAFCGFLALSVWESIVQAVRIKLGG